jgi:hypothetical protein
MILEVNLKRRRFNHELPVLSPTIGLGAKQNRAPKCSGSAPIWLKARREFETIKGPPTEMPIGSCDDLFPGMERGHALGGEREILQGAF